MASSRKQPPKSGKSFVTTDSFQNFAAKLGMGADNLISRSTYGRNLITRNRQKLENVYRGSWLGGAAVNMRAEDMTRAGVEIESELDPGDKKKIEQEVLRLQVWPALGESLQWSRLYGGSIALMMIAGQDKSTELRPETVGRGQFLGIKAIDRWPLMPSLHDLLTENDNVPAHKIGTPRYYYLTDQTLGLNTGVIHHSRVFRFEGVKLPHYQRVTENLWGASIYERLWDRLVSFDSATMGAAQMVYRAWLRVVKVKDFRSNVATGGKMMEGLSAMFNSMRLFQSTEGLTIIDGEDEFETYQYQFSGLTEIINQLAEQVAGAVETPVTRLFGTSPGGMNATGESDMRNYYDSCNSDQNSQMGTEVPVVYDMIARSLGINVPAGTRYPFKTLWQMTEKEKAEIASQRTDSIIGAAGQVKRSTVLRELKQQGAPVNAWTSITDQEINEAEAEPPPTVAAAEQQATENDLAESTATARAGGNSEG